MSSARPTAPSDLDFARIEAQFQPEFSPSSPRLPVLYLNHCAQMSGAEASLRALLWGLRRAELPIEATVALPGQGPFAELLRREGWSVKSVPLRRLSRPRRASEWLGALRTVVQAAPRLERLIRHSGAQIVHANSTTSHLTGGLAARRANKPAVWHCRDLVALGRFAPLLSRQATRVIAISNCVAALLEREGVPHDKIAVVYNGLDANEWRPRPRSHWRESLDLPSHTFLFGCVGQVVPWKNHRAFIEAAALLMQDERTGEAHFALIGGDLWAQHAAYRGELHELVRQLGLGDRFHFAGYIGDAADAISGLDALIHPAHDEPFGRIILEAMALGKPVVAMNQNGPREIISHERDGLLVAPLEPDGLTRAMKRLLHDHSLSAHLTRHAHQTVETQFRADDHARHIASIYREIRG